MRHNFISLFILTATLTFSSCGGGGGGGSQSSPDAAHVSVRAAPSKIDSADRTTVSVTIHDVNDLGILLKIRFPSGLAYVEDTAQLEVDGDIVDASPAINKVSGDKTYLVFFLQKSSFDNDGNGKIRVILKGKSAVKDGLIEVDADVNDPNVVDSKEFKISDPKFDAQDGADITVTDSSGAAS